MNTRTNFLSSIAKIGLLLLSVIISSCNALKRVENDEYLLIKNTLFANDEKVTNEDIHSLIVQKPNSKLLGYPLRLNLYNLAKKNPDSSFQAWLYKKEKREQRLINWLSKKQVNKLGESFLIKGYSNWLKNIGEPPTIVDTSKTKKSTDRLEAYYGGKGYFNNKATFSVIPKKRKKRAQITYNVHLGKPYFLDTITKEIKSTAIDSIYVAHKNKSLIKSGSQFNINKFNEERERLTTLFRNSGVYNFQESAISYSITRDTIIANKNQAIGIELQIDNLKTRDENTLSSSEYKAYKFNNINVYTDYYFGQENDSLQSVSYNNYTFYYKDKLRYKLKALSNAIFIHKDSVYREVDKTNTYRQIASLNTFKYPTIKPVPDSTNTKLNTNIYLAARPKYSLETNFDITHSNIQRLGIAFSSSLITRNIFGGAETLSFSGRGTFGILKGPSAISEDIFSEVGGDINLTFPRIWMPLFNTEKIIPFHMLPQTRMTLGTSFQKNIGLDKQTFNSILGYNWSPNNHKKNNLELLNLQFVRNVNTNRYFDVYQNSFNRLNGIASEFNNNANFSSFFNENGNLSIPTGATGFISEVLNNGLQPSDLDDIDIVKSIEERRKRLTEDNLIFTSNYTFHKNNKEDINDNDFYQYRIKIESAGNLLSGLSHLINFSQNSDNKLLVLKVPYSQYIKTEIEYIKHWKLSLNNELAFRSFFGIAIPYGNSDNIPFTRSYFAGGSYDNRAWHAYSLGPGRTQDLNDFNEANLKLAINLEYRFPIVGAFKGALFADAGNIWNTLDNIEDKEATFNSISSLKDMALGTGFGIRYDLSYFVIRGDIGFKTHNPAEEASKRWFRDYNFKNAVLNIGINYPF